MKAPLKLLGIALAVVLVATGLVAAGYGSGAAPADGEGTTADGDRAVGPTADADRPLNGTNSPWMTGDARIDRFQDRFGLSDAQMEELRAEVTATIQDGADRDAIRAQVQTMLHNFGVENPTLGPMDGQRLGDGPHAGDGPHGGTEAQAGHGLWAGNGQGGAGPHGPADGSCMG